MLFSVVIGIGFITEKEKKVGQVTAGNGLVGFTSETVSVKHGNQVWIFDENGHQTGAISAK